MPLAFSRQYRAALIHSFCLPDSDAASVALIDAQQEMAACKNTPESGNSTNSQLLNSKNATPSFPPTTGGTRCHWI